MWKLQAKTGVWSCAGHPAAEGAARDRWLTRDELAAVLWACWRYREVQTVHRGKRRGEPQETEKRPLRHLARFILLAIYSGSRAGASADGLAPSRRGPFLCRSRARHLLPPGRRCTRDQQAAAASAAAAPPARPSAPLVRRKGIVSEHFVEWNGRPVKSVKTAFKTALRLAKAERTDQSAHVASHRGDLADAERRRQMGGGRLSRHVGRDA